MNMHKNTRLMPYHREEIWRLYNKEKATVTYLPQRFRVCQTTIYNALRLAAKRHNKSYPGEMLHVDTKRGLKSDRRDYLFTVQCCKISSRGCTCPMSIYD